MRGSCVYAALLARRCKSVDESRGLFSYVLPLLCRLRSYAQRHSVFGARKLFTAELLNAVEEFFDAMAPHETVAPCLRSASEAKSKGLREDNKSEGFDACHPRVDCANLSQPGKGPVSFLPGEVPPKG